MKALTMIDEHETVSLALPGDMQFGSWVEMMAGLFQRRRQAEWMIADGLRFGSEHFADEPQMQMFLEQTGIDRKEVDEMAKVARLIPETWRTDRLSFDVCRKIAKIEDESDRQHMLKQAVDQRWNEKKAHRHIVEYRYEHGDMFEDEDRDTRIATEVVRCWNRATPAARAYFFQLAEMAAANGYTPIDEDEAI